MKLIEINGSTAIGEAMGMHREIRVDFISDPKPGEYVIVHAGFAIERMGAAEAEESIKAAEEVENELRKLI